MGQRNDKGLVLKVSHLTAFFSFIYTDILLVHNNTACRSTTMRHLSKLQTSLTTYMTYSHVQYGT